MQDLGRSGFTNAAGGCEFGNGRVGATSAADFRHGPHPGRSLLLARRLIEAGAWVVIPSGRTTLRSTSFELERQPLVGRTRVVLRGN